MDDFPLLDLFIQLRKAGLPIGISEYKLLLKAFQKGIGTSDYESLARLCKTIWVNSPDELNIFNYYFDKLVEQENASEPCPVKEELQEEEIQDINSPIIRRIVGGLILVLGLTTIWWNLSRPKYPVVELPNEPIVEDESNASSVSPPPINSSPSSSDELPDTEDTPTPVEPVVIEPAFPYLLAIVLSGFLTSGCLLVFKGKEKKPISDDSSFSELAVNNQNSTATSQFIRAMEDEVQVVQILLSDRFSSNTEFLPITRRQMKQSWRYLRHSIREGPPVELDIEATVEQVARQGSFLNPVLMPRYVNRTELLLLIDRDGSMIPFHSLSQRLADTAAREGRLGNAGIYYFHNCPIKYIYRDTNHLEAECISNVLAGLHRTRATVLIISDAGATRGSFNPERLRLTKNFLDQTKLYVRQVAWLNPMPCNRWKETTAQEIARFIPMFEINRQGLDRAIDVLRGRSRFVEYLD